MKPLNYGSVSSHKERETLFFGFVSRTYIRFGFNVPNYAFLFIPDCIQIWSSGAGERRRIKRKIEYCHSAQLQRAIRSVVDSEAEMSSEEAL